MGHDGVIHVVTLDGKMDISGPQLPLSSLGEQVYYGSGIANAGFAPNGHTLAFSDPLLNIIDVANGHQIGIPESPLSAPNSSAWSPDGTMLALAGGNAEFDLAKASDGTITTIPNTPFPGNPPEANILSGWLDATHIAVSGFLPSVVGQPTVTFVLYSLNVTTGMHTVIFQMQLPAEQEDTFILSLDGRKGLFFNTPLQNNPITPFVDEVDIASGAITPLPSLAQLSNISQNLWIDDITWQPGSEALALTTGFTVNGDLKNWLVNLQQGSIAPLPGIGYPEEWSPDGKTLVFSSDLSSSIGAGPFTLTALTFGANRQTTQAVLTTQAYNFNLIGFVRTASGG
jgi:WD40 repeat protein